MKMSNTKKIENELKQLKKSIKKANCPQAEALVCAFDLIRAVSSGPFEAIGMLEELKYGCKKMMDAHSEECECEDKFPGVV